MVCKFSDRTNREENTNRPRPEQRSNPEPDDPVIPSLTRSSSLDRIRNNVQNIGGRIEESDHVHRIGREKLKCIYTNLDGISSKIGEFQSVIFKENPDLIFLTETKANDSLLSSNIFDTSKYKVYRKDRAIPPGAGIWGGGVCILVRSNIVSDDVFVDPLNKHQAEEGVWCEVSLRNNRKLILGSVYRTPSSTSANNDLICDLMRSCERISGENQVVVCGDFNYSSILWEDNSVDADGYYVGQASNFLEAINDCHWAQHIKEWTHLRDTDNPSRLDLVFSKHDQDIVDVEYSAPIGLSKHAVIKFNVLIENPDKDRAGVTPRLNFHKGDYVKLKELLSNVDWATEFEGKSTNERWQIFLYYYRKYVKECIPTFIPKYKNETSKWMNRKIKNLLKQKEIAWRRYRDRKCPTRRQVYNTIRNKVTFETRKAKKEFEKRIAMDSKEDSKHFWAYSRSKLKFKEQVSRVKKVDGDLTTTDEETAEVMNEAFNSVFVRENPNEAVPEIEQIIPTPDITEIDFTPNQVLRHLKKLKPNKACGPDGISPMVLSKCADVLYLPLYDIFILSIRESEVPLDWRSAVVPPIFKKGSKTEAKNYRPVSLTSVVVKILESLIREVIVRHLEENNIITNKQHGFRQGRSCLTNLLDYLDDLISAVDEKQCVDVNYLDCEKAFDRVPHRRLIAKVRSVGIAGKVLDWIEKFLEGRQQKVRIRDSESTWLPVHSGVPQGSVLGPVLFIIYINDIVRDLESGISLFADDAKVYRRITTPEDAEILQRDMEKLNEWSRKWLLSFNVTKCKTMHIGHNNPRHNYQLQGNALEKSDLEKDLGVFVSSDLKPSMHIAKVAAKANARVGLIKRTFSYIDKEIFLSLYTALVRPILDYGVQCWSPYLVKDINKLEQVQRRATLLVPECSALSYVERCKFLGIQSLQDRRVRGDMIEVYRLLTGMEGVHYSRYFQLSESHARGEGYTRGHSKKLIKPNHWRTTLKGNWFTIRSIDPWNSLPEEVVSAPSIAVFKKRYDLHMSQSN